MPLERYGVLKGGVVDCRRGVGRSRHYQVHVRAGSEDYRIAINFRSKVDPSELVYVVREDFLHPVTDVLADLPPGFTDLAREPASGALDYVRGNLFQLQDLRTQSPDAPARGNDLRDKLDTLVRRAMRQEGAAIHVFGEPWGPERDTDKLFGFEPSRGMHEVHMNQGNSDKFDDNDGTWQDGGVLFHYPVARRADGREWRGEHWAAVFLAFRSQAWHTDDRTGHRLEPAVDRRRAAAAGMEREVRIVAALVNPGGDDSDGETVTILNTTPRPIPLGGWVILDAQKRRKVLEDAVLGPGAALAVTLSDGEARLSNKGGTISLLDPLGRKVDGVSYTRRQAMNQGWTVVF